MIISHKHKFIIIDIPKTGTRSFCELLMPFNPDIIGATGVQGRYLQHDTAVDIRRKMEEDKISWREYFSMTRVRDPWRRYASFVAWSRSFLRDYESNPENYKIYKSLYTSFSDIWKSGDEKQVLEYFILKEKPQHHYFMEGEEVIVDHVGTLENINDSMKVLQRETKLSLPELPWTHRNEYEWRNLYTDELIQTVAEKEKYTIEKFNYETPI